MDDLQRKYIDDNLSVEELRKLRERVNALSVEDIGKVMSKDWEEFLDSQSEDVTDTMMRIKTEIDRRIETGTPKRHLKVERIFSVAASILLPLFIVATIYLYLDSSRSELISKPACVTTAAGERAKVVLYDGTEVQLNSSSTIEYYARYIDGKRCAEFSGEAYFNVNKDPDHPFCISTHGVAIEVKGTSFNLSARDNADFVEVALDSGHVELISDMTSDAVSLKPGQIALVNRSTGDISVTDEDTNLCSAWLRNEITLVNVTPDELFERIEDTYGVTVPQAIKSAVNDRFTGTLPSDDLDEVYAVLSRIYGFSL